MESLATPQQEKPLGITFDNGRGTTYVLDWDIPHGGQLIMTPRDKALAHALLMFALENVEKAETSHDNVGRVWK